MSKNTTDEQMKHYDRIIEQFDSVHMPSKQREIIMTEIEQLISNREKLARVDTIRRCLMMLVNKPDTALDLMQEWHDSLIKETAK